MECWYDSLFECECEGIHELMKVPCSGTWLTFNMTVGPTGMVGGPTLPWKTKLGNRITWIIKCASLSAFWIISFDDWKTNTWKYFIEAYQMRIWYEKEGKWFWEVKDLQPHSCYYLGRYPMYWDYDTYQLVSPLGQFVHRPFTERVLKKVQDPAFKPPARKTTAVWLGHPYHPTAEWEAYKNQPEEDNRFFLGNEIVDNWMEQLAAAEWLKTRSKDCIAKHYAKPEKVPKGKVMTPQGLADWPGKPFDQLTLPTPEVLPTPAPGIPYTRITLKITMRFSPIERPDGLTIDLEYY